jgi:hypothetical protein
VKTIVLLLLLVLGSSQAPLDQAFGNGETLDFDLAWMKMSGGSARMTLAPAGENRIRMTLVAKSGTFFSRIFKVRDEIESLVRRDTMSTLEYRKQLDERGRRKDELTVVNEETRTATRKGKTFDVPTPVVDPLSLMYLLRMRDLTAGSKHEFTVMADGKVYQLQAIVVRRETIRTAAGTFRTVLVEPKMQGGGVFSDGSNRLWIWYSDDDRRLPVRIRSEVNVGTITASLRAVTAGVTSTEPPAVSDR